MSVYHFVSVFCVFFNDTATTEIYTYGHTLSLHDALPISRRGADRAPARATWSRRHPARISRGSSQHRQRPACGIAGQIAPGHRRYRKSVVLGKILSVRVALGGLRFIKKNFFYFFFFFFFFLFFFFLFFFFFFYFFF